MKLQHSEPTDCNPPQRVFLLSSPRAGSTLVSRVLNSHSAISSPCEICIPFVVTSSWKFIKSLTTIAKISRYYGAALPKPRLLLGTRRAARRHFDGLTENILRQEGKRTLVVKDPRHAAHVEKLEALYADQPPKYILLHRDARAVCHSFTSTLGRKPERGFRAWLQCTEGMLVCQRRCPERCLSIRFEDFVADSAAAALQLTSFIGHEFESAMLEYGKHNHADDRLGLWSNPKLVSSVKRGTIETPRKPSWTENAEMLTMYAELPDVQAVNRQVGYDQTEAKQAA